MIPSLAVWGLFALARLAFCVSYTDSTDGVACDVYRLGREEVDVCTYGAGGES